MDEVGRGVMVLDNTASIEILDSCKRVFNAETITNAEQELSLQFANLGMQDASFAPGLVTALYAGKFLWTKNFTPSNFSPFMICEAEPPSKTNAAASSFTWRTQTEKHQMRSRRQEEETQ